MLVDVGGWVGVLVGKGVGGMGVGVGAGGSVGDDGAGVGGGGSFVCAQAGVTTANRTPPSTAKTVTARMSDLA
ncbi:MAG: hypothetical protein MUP92_01725, partial [Actinobacteria bacterium]|nr:hypothetical protein [Actinomycetota bacterium]